jgi:hypothetical protein
MCSVPFVAHPDGLTLPAMLATGVLGGLLIEFAPLEAWANGEIHLDGDGHHELIWLSPTVIKPVFAKRTFVAKPTEAGGWVEFDGSAGVRVSIAQERVFRNLIGSSLTVLTEDINADGIPDILIGMDSEHPDAYTACRLRAHRLLGIENPIIRPKIWAASRRQAGRAGLRRDNRGIYVPILRRGGRVV